MAGSKIVTCKTCGKEIAKSAKVCPHCGAKQGGGKLPIIIGVLAVLLILVVVGGGGSKDKDESGTSTESTTQSSQATEEKTQATTQEQPSSGSDYTVTIDGASIGTDYAGAPCIIVNYTFTNVSNDEPISFLWAVSDGVYQNGVECESAILSDATDKYSNDIKKGVSIGVTRAYKLNDTTTDVEVTVLDKQFFGDDIVLAERTFSIA